MSMVGERFGLLGWALSIPVGIGYECYHIFDPGHAQDAMTSPEFLKGALLGFFDGQNPINWLWDTPGDMLANLWGHGVAFADIVTLGSVNASAAGAWALTIPGPDYSGPNPDFMDFAGPGATTPYGGGGSNAGGSGYHYPGAGLPPR